MPLTPEDDWEPDPPAWEPEPDPEPWRASLGPEPEREHRPAPAPTPAVTPMAGPGTGPAYLAVAGLLVVSVGLGLLTVGLHARSPWTKTLLAAGSALMLAGFGALALAAWLVGGLDPGPRPPGRP